jgi:DNA-binding MarR family transcriptional regulator
MSEGRTTVTPSHVDNAFAAMLEELDSEFEVRWLSRFSNQQRRIVQALSKLGEARLKDIAAEMMVHSPDISSAISRLKDMMILQRRENGSYYITDRVFAAWIASM